MRNNREHRDLEFRASANGKTMTGQITYRSRSRFMGFYEQLNPQCFAGTLDDPKSDVVACWDHIEGQILGRQSNRTLALVDTSSALKFSCTLDEDTVWGSSAIAALARRDIIASSFAMLVTKDEWSELPDGNLLRTIVAADLIHIAPVANPAYLANATGLRKQQLNTALRTASSDQKIKLLELLALRNDPTDSIVGPGRIITSQTPEGKTTVAFGADFCQCDTQDRDRQLTCGTCQASVLYLSKYDEFSCACGENDAPNHVCAQCGLAFDRSNVKEKPILLEQVQETQEIGSKCTTHRCETCGATFGDADQQQDYLGSSQDDARSLHLALLQRRMAE